jgi:hypothetical protein
LTTKKSILVENTSDVTAQFSISSNHESFKCSSDDYVIEARSSIIMDFLFHPNGNSYQGEYEILFSNGIKVFISSRGIGKNLNVSLSTSSIVLDSCYMTLWTMKTIKIKNMSDINVNYSFRS